MSLSRKFLLAGLLVLSFPAVSQTRQPELSFRHITRQDGLSNSSVSAICQDRRGFIWFGTADGLNRYDGKKIVVYRNETEDRRSLSNNFIHCLFVDKKERLWIGTADGLNKFDPRTNSFIRVPLLAEQLSEEAKRVTCISEDGKRRLWIGFANGGLARLNAGGTALLPEMTGTPNTRTINCITAKTRQTLWLGTDAGLKVYDIEKRRLVNTDQAITSSLTAKIQSLTRSRTGVLWVGTEEQGLYCLSEQQAKLTHYRHIESDPRSLSSDRITCILEASKDQLLVGTVNGGLCVFDTKTRRFYNYINDALVRGSLSQRSVLTAFEDKQHNIWVGTPRGGVNVTNFNEGNFRLVQKVSETSGLSNSDVRSFHQSQDGRIWIGTDGGGLDRYDPVTDTYQAFRHDPRNSRSIGSNQVLCMLEDSKKRFWVGTWDGGLNLLLPQSGFRRYLHDAHDKYSIASNMVENIFEDRAKNIWVCLYNGGVQRFDPETGKFYSIGKEGGADRKLFGKHALSINEDKKGNLWIATFDGGLNRYDPQTGSFKHYFTNMRNEDLSSVFIDSQGLIWAGKKKLLVFDEKRDRFTSPRGSKPLPQEFVKSILEARKGELWLSTGNGIIQYNSTNGSFRKYNLDGSDGPEFEVNSRLKTREGTIYFGSTTGFVVFHPDSIRLNRFAPPVLLTDFYLFNKRISPRDSSILNVDISVAHQLVLSHRQSSFAFEFAALNYIHPENNTFAYKLEGFDPDWNFIGKQQRAAYTNIGPGEYVFRVKASNNDGVWNSAGTSIRILITPPFYVTWWFITIAAFAAVLFLYRVYRFKSALNYKAIQEKQKEVIQQNQLEFFTNITHEFRTPLSLIVGPAEALERSDSDPQRLYNINLIRKNAYRLLQLVNDLMDFRKAESDVFKLQVSRHASLDDLQEIMKEFTATADARNIRYQVKLALEEEYFWYDSQILEKILLNLLNNAFKYTSSGGEIICDRLASLAGYQSAFGNHLQIKSPAAGKKELIIRVRDSGVGISSNSLENIFERFYQVSSNRLGSGIGLAFVKSLVRIHKGDIYVWSDRGKGTEFVIALPVSESAYVRDEKLETEPERYQSTPESGVHVQDMTDARVESPVIDVALQKAQHILIVEDNKEMREFLRHSLMHTYRVSTAGNGHTGHLMAREIMPDLIISDLMMPLMDGNSFCAKLKNDIETSHIPFVMLTAKSSLDARIQGTLVGVDAYLTKPFSVELLLATVHTIFESLARIRQHYIRDYMADAVVLAQTQRDKEFIRKLSAIIEQHITDPQLDIELIVKDMAMSQSTIYQKLKTITGQSIVEFIRSYRLKKAMQILVSEGVSINEAIFRVGIQTASYFTRIFKSEYGKTPSEFLKGIRKP